MSAPTGDLYSETEALTRKLIAESMTGTMVDASGQTVPIDFTEKVKLVDAAARLMAYKAKHQPDKKASAVDGLREQLQRGNSKGAGRGAPPPAAEVNGGGPYGGSGARTADE